MFQFDIISHPLQSHVLIMYASAAFLAPSNVKLRNALICFNLLNVFEEIQFDFINIHSLKSCWKTM